MVWGERRGSVQERGLLDFAVAVLNSQLVPGAGLGVGVVVSGLGSRRGPGPVP